MPHCSLNAQFAYPIETCPCEASLGRLLTTSIDKFERSVRDDRPDVRKASAPDGTVSIAFSDIESSTAPLERLGDTEFLRMVGWHDRTVRDTAAEHRGSVVKLRGTIRTSHLGRREGRSGVRFRAWASKNLTCGLGFLAGACRSQLILKASATRGTKCAYRGVVVASPWFHETLHW